MAKVKVAVIGGTGLLGTPLTQGFLQNGNYDVTVITRKGSGNSALVAVKEAGASIVEVDFADQQSLIDGLKGQEIVVSAVGTAALADQPKYVEAAKAAGVRRFVPSEFGIDIGVPGMLEYFPLFGYKFATRAAVEASGLEWTYIITGFFVESTFIPFFYFDPAAGKATIKGNPDAVFVLTSLVDVGKWTAEALLDPASKNASVYLKGSETTMNQVVKTIEAVTGKSLDVTYVSKEQLDEQVANPPDLYTNFADRLMRSIADSFGTLWSDDKAFKGPKDASVTLAKHAETWK